MKPLLSKRPSWLTQLGLSLTFVLILAGGVVLSAVFFALLLALSVVVGGWLWWQTRHLRRQLREPFIDTDYSVESEHNLIEAEYQVLEEHQAQATVGDPEKSRN